MSEKDFLEQFSSNNKPDSFKEEERVKVTKEKKPLNVKLLIQYLPSPFYYLRLFQKFKTISQIVYVNNVVSMITARSLRHIIF